MAASKKAHISPSTPPATALRKPRTESMRLAAVRAGKYVTDRIYVGYTRRFEADPERGENTDEVRVEYQIDKRWTFESRYGSSQAGGASLIWSKEY